MNRFAHKTELVISLCLCLLLAACSKETDNSTATEPEPATSESSGSATTEAADDVIARVGDQTITFSEINTVLNSAAVVGLSIPTFGTPERDIARMTLLDKLISANLIYLDALERGMDKDPEYQAVIEKFSNAILASIYRKKYLDSSIVISDEEIETFYKSSMAQDSELNEDMKAAIEAILRKKQLEEHQLNMTQEVRKGHTITINEAALDPSGEQERKDTEIVATLDGDEITWGEIKSTFLGPVSSGSMDKRRAALNRFIDYRLILQAAKAANMEQDPQYQKRVGEFTKTRLINFHRQKLLEEMEPTDEDVTAYYEEYGDRIMVPEARKVQMVVVKTREEAEEIKQQIESGELSVSKASAEYSIVPDADKNLGEIGWVNKGSGFPALDELTFSLAPDEIGGPVESPAGWHLILVQDQREASNESLGSPGTREKIRAGMIDERLDQYTVDLRMNKFSVVVYDEVITELAQNEADWFRELTEKSEQSQEKLVEQVQALER